MAYRKFGRDSSARKAMLRDVVNALLEKERIQTTEAKAKEVGGLADQRCVDGAIREFGSRIK